VSAKFVPANSAEATVWIDAYLAAQPQDKRAVLQTLRETIAAAAPDAEETVSYQLPAFRYRGKALVWYHATKAYCSFFPTIEPIEVHQADLAEFETSKGTIKFKPEKPIPTDVVRKIVAYRIGQIDAAVATKKK
jgi:uncharacterized protein YdhG (YjbR/CyaY superfamily)